MARQSARRVASTNPASEELDNMPKVVKDDRDPDGFYSSPIKQRVALTSGDVFLFEAGKPQFVREDIRPRMLSYGVMPVTGVVPETKVVSKDKVEPVGQKRIDALDAAIADVVKRNDTKDFSAGGIPKVDVLTKLAGFEVTDKVRDKHWKLNRQKASAR